MSTIALKREVRPTGRSTLGGARAECRRHRGGHRDGRGCLAAAGGDRGRGGRHFPRRTRRPVPGLVGRGGGHGHHFRGYRDVCDGNLCRQIGPLPSPAVDRSRDQIGAVGPFEVFRTAT